MFLYAVSNSDIHESVDKGEGLRINGINVGSLTLADDTVLLSLTPRDLQSMVDRAHEYSRKWRIRFSNSKSKCVVFGETTRGHRISKGSRSWHMGNNTLDEVDSYCHMGVTLQAVPNSSRVTLVSNKGKGMLASLAGVGLRMDGLNPIYSSKLWEKRCLP